MSHALAELDQILSNPDFWDGDLFMVFDELVPRLDDGDVVELFRLRQHRTQEWRENFLVAVGDMNRLSLWKVILDLLNSDDPARVSEGLGFFAFRNWGAELITEAVMDTLERLWRTCPDWRAAIQQTLWQAGKSGQLRRRLGFERWSDSSALNDADSNSRVS